MSTTQSLIPPDPTTAAKDRPPARTARAAIRSGGTKTDDLADLLRLRMIVILVMVAAVNTLFVIRAVVAPAPIWQVGLAAILRAHPLVGANTAVALAMWAAAAVIWRRKALPVSRLRAVELVCLAVNVAFVIGHNWFRTEAYVASTALAELQFVDVLAKSNCFLLSLTIMGYGVFIPNTWRRCLIVLASIAVLGTAVSAACLAWYSIPRGFLESYVASMSIYLGGTIGIAVYGAHRISILRVQVREARRLGQYVLRDRLGGGGMGEVFRAEHALLRRPAAVKLIRSDRAGDPANLARFEREVQATASLSHPNTIQIFDYGQTDDGTFYYVMEYLEGPTLEALVQTDGPLPTGRAIYLLRQVCMALREAHAIRLIHRDLKPSNVIVTRRGGLHDVIKLLDFGLVRAHAGAAGESAITQTHEGTVAGTPAYMSPEQAQAQDRLDPRSDVYSLGAKAYFMATSRAPFAGRSHVAMLAAHIYESPEPPDQLRPSVPADFQEVVLRCLAKNPNDRFPEVVTLEKALAGCRDAPNWSEDSAAEWWRSWIDSRHALRHSGC